MEYTTSKWLPNPNNELEVFKRLQLTHFHERHGLATVYHRIMPQLQMVFSYSPSEILELISQSNEWYKRDQKNPLDPSVRAQLLEIGYRIGVRLKTSKITKIRLSDAP